MTLKSSLPLFNTFKKVVKHAFLKKKKKKILDGNYEFINKHVINFLHFKLYYKESILCESETFGQQHLREGPSLNTKYISAFMLPCSMAKVKSE